MVKIRYKNRIFKKYNYTDNYDRTPTESETEEIKDMNKVADNLYKAGVIDNSISDKNFILIANQLDQIPIVSKYFRYLMYEF